MIKLKSSYDAYQIIKYKEGSINIDKLSNEDRHTFLETLFNTTEYAMDFLTSGQYKNDIEKEWALRIVLRSPDFAARLYCHYSDILTSKQLYDAFNIAFDKWSAILILFNSGKLTDIQRIDAIKHLRTSSYQCELIIKENKLTEDELELILEYHKENKNILKAILNYQKDSINQRRQAFDLYIRNTCDIFDSAKDNHFNAEELKIVHDIFWGEMFEARKRTYKDYLLYCEIFFPVLNETELDNLIKRLIAYKSSYDIKKFSKLIPAEYALKLEGFLVAERLRGR